MLAMMAPSLTPADELDGALAERGFAVIDATALCALLEVLPGVAERAFAQWALFWNRLAPDQYLRDGGRYRQRRHGSFVVEGERVTPAPPRAHWQPVEYNALHGGIERWFEPMDPAAVELPIWPRLLLGLAGVADRLKGARPWFVEAHQFRIDTAGGIGRPTPEGAHRDGVDLVAVFMLARHGIKGGESRVFEADGPRGQRFTMMEPWTLLLLDDERVIHETTPIQPMEPTHPGHRDTLVVTLRADAFMGR
jgi:hypothetical protein